MRSRSTSRRQNLNRSDWKYLTRIGGGGDDAGFRPGGITVFADRRQPTTRLATPEQLFSDTFVKNLITAVAPLAARLDKSCECGAVPPELLLRVIMGEAKNRIKCNRCYDRIKAIKWAAVIFRYFRKQDPSTAIEQDMGWKRGMVKNTAQKIRRYLDGKRLDGRPRTGHPPGRPAQNSHTHDATINLV